MLSSPVTTNITQNVAKKIATIAANYNSVQTLSDKQAD